MSLIEQLDRYLREHEDEFLRDGRIDYGQLCEMFVGFLEGALPPPKERR